MDQLLDGFPTLELRSQRLEARFVPALGGKLTSLRDLASGREWLLPPQRPLRAASWGADFSQFDISGCDDCFPSVARGPYAALSGQAPSLELPDHGELWSRPWEASPYSSGIRFQVRGAAWPYLFERHVSLESDALRFDYRLTNQAERPFTFLWSAHPLFAVEPGMRIEIPRTAGSVLIDSAQPAALGSPGRERPWPELTPGVDLSKVGERSSGIAVKAFTSRLDEGRASIYLAGQGGLRVEWDVAAAPYLGLWLCYGGWPHDDDGQPAQLTVALEPCSGRPDALVEAVRRRECQELAAGAQTKWWMRFRLL